MRTLTDHLSRYAAYHRDRRNIATHFIGIPMILLAVVILLSRPPIDLLGWSLSPASFAAALAILFYLRLDRRLGLVMAALLGVSLWIGDAVAQWPHMMWLSTGIGLFVLGWVIQFVGHMFEGRKPAFLDDLSGLIIGPLFVVAEAGFLFGLRKDLQRRIETAIQI